ncbi:biotin/lipoate A/B protein ligase family protein [Nesterenkonia aurantiaca]|uniref:lipoate--protein ligase family protein n=1 Tax=Nesterenkonia aurantiaca TaxID=1436010 RepID=UPI003EE7439D
MTDTHQQHGEYKVVGGKLVVVDLHTDLDPRIHPREAKITAASVNGDFFLEPDEALGSLNAALIGLPTRATREEIAESVRAQLPAEAQMFGFDEYAIATAVRRALGHATRWEDHDWEVMPAVQLPVEMHVALDQVLTEEVGRGNRPPLMRMWDYSGRAVVIGSFQSLANEVDSEAAQRMGATVVRRITGGGAMYMDEGSFVTYSLSVPASLVDGLSFADSYPFLDAWAMEALTSIGITASYKPLNDIVSTEGKIGGAAQKRLASGGMVHHVTMSYDMNADDMLQVLRIGREKISDKGITSAAKRVDPLRSQTGLARAEILDAFVQTFATKYGARVAEIRPEELARAEQLVQEKFSTQDWTARVP